MTEQDLRALVRDVIARRASESSAAAAGAERAPAGSPPVVVAVGGHLSHGMFSLPAGDGPCLIEPAVPCTHCGYCRSYGH
jgi:hypothetical protein